MIPRSTAIATAAILLSLMVHFLGLSLTARQQVQQPVPEAASNTVAVGNAFEDVAEAVSEPVQPEEAAIPEPEPEPETVPEPETAETPTSEALVASPNPQRVASPDTGTGQIVRPETTGPSELAVGDVPEPETPEPSKGQENDIADAPAAPPAGAETFTEVQKGKPDGSAQPVEANSAEITQTVNIAPVPEQLAALPPVTAPSIAPTPAPSSVPIVPLDSEVADPDAQTEPVAPDPDSPESPAAEADPDGSVRAISSSLRPQLRTQRPSPEPEGLSDGAPEVADTLLAPSQRIESPLTAYQRDGTNLFAGRNGGTRSGGIGFQNSGGTGNSDVTNYAGQVLMHLNRVRPVAVSGRGWARVFFEINPDGTLAWVNIIDGVGSPEIDSAAKIQVRNGVPFPRPPGGKSRKLNFVYRID